MAKKREIIEVKDWEAFSVDGDFIVRIKDGKVEVVSLTSCFIHMDRKIGSQHYNDWAQNLKDTVDKDEDEQG